VRQVLIVDDDPNICKLLAFALERAGFAATTAQNGDQGLALATQKPPDVAILDVMMPGVNGYELCRRLRADTRTQRIKIIFLTARSQPIDEQEALKAGADRFLSKPIMHEDLVREINLLLPDEESAVSAPSTPEPETTAVEKEHTKITPPSRTRGRLIVCFSPSSRVGVTTLAVNLAVAFSASLRARTPLFELHTVQDSVLPAFGFGSESIRGNLRATGDELNWDTLIFHFLDHPTGVRVLPAPPPGTNVPPVITRQALSLLLSKYPLVLADAASELDIRVQSTLLAADLILLMITPEVTSIRAAIQTIQNLRALDFSEQQILLIVNNVHRQPQVPVDQIAKGMRRPVFSVIPHEPEVQNAFRSGRPLLVASPRSPASRAIGRIAMQLARAFNIPAGD
jgi:CheY-like chemotaxis protein/MinD-like ATPase involved in chromosome partitioning or flagellar assembly